MAESMLTSLMGTLGPLISQIMTIVFFFTKIMLGIVAISMGIYYLTFDCKMMVAQLVKGNRVIISEKRVREFKSKDGIPKLKSFGIPFLMPAEVVNQGPSDSIYPYRSMLVKKLYCYVKKDGIYFPVSNFVLGTATQNEDGTIEYSIEGSGLEISRDFDAEQAAMNNQKDAVDRHKKKKPAEVVMAIGLMIVTILVVGAILIYGFAKTAQGALANAEAAKAIAQMGAQVAQQQLGPG